MTRTIRLTEYRPREVRLRRADVDFLLGPARGVVDLAPTSAPDRYRLTAGGFVGILSGPTVRFVLKPKVPRANLYLLLDPDAPPDDVPDRSEAERGPDALDFLARRLAAGMRQRAAAGLSRGYVERSDQQPFLQGRLDVAAQTREPPTARDRFHVTRDEFTSDLPVHQFPKATAEAVLASPHISATTRGAVAGRLGRVRRRHPGFPRPGRLRSGAGRGPPVPRPLPTRRRGFEAGGNGRAHGRAGVPDRHGKGVRAIRRAGRADGGRRTSRPRRSSDITGRCRRDSPRSSAGRTR